MLGLAAAAGLALSLIAGASSAAAYQFHTSAANATLEGEAMGTQSFEFAGNDATCLKTTVSGTHASKTTETLEVEPKFSGCTFAGFSGAVIDTSGCVFELRSNSPLMDLKSCTKGSITFHVSAFFGTSTCHLSVKNQLSANGIVILKGTQFDTKLWVEAATNNLDFEVLEDKGLCPFEKKGQTGSNGEYVGITTVAAPGGTIWLE